MKIRCVEDNIIVKRDESEGTIKTEGGLALHHEGERNRQASTGVVLAIGPGKLCHSTRSRIMHLAHASDEYIESVRSACGHDDEKIDEFLHRDCHLPMPCKVGDRIAFATYAQETVIDGERVLCIEAGDVIGVIEEGDEG